MVSNCVKHHKLFSLRERWKLCFSRNVVDERKQYGEKSFEIKF